MNLRWLNMEEFFPDIDLWLLITTVHLWSGGQLVVPTSQISLTCCRFAIFLGIDNESSHSFNVPDPYSLNIATVAGSEEDTGTGADGFTPRDMAGGVGSSPEIGDISSPLRNVSGISYYRQFNMAAVATRSRKKRISYTVLHNLSSVDVLFDRNKRRSSSKSVGTFEAERVIASWEDSEVRIRFNLNCLFSGI